MPDNTQENRLANRWVHHHEDDDDVHVVFRTSDFPFPPARGRIALDIALDGTLLVEHPGPDDRRAGTAGQWSLTDNILTVTSPAWAGDFEIESLDDRTLVLRRR